MKKLLFIIPFLFGCSKPEKITIRYEATGYVDITLINPQGGTEQYNDRDGFWYEWEQDMIVDNFKYISAQNNNGTGTVSVCIKENGVIIKSSNCTGGYCIATASY